MKTTRTSVRTGAKAAHEVTGSRRKRISIQLARYGVVAALVLGIFMSAAQIVQDYRSEDAELDAIMDRIMDMARPPATTAAQYLDETQAKQIVDGLMTYEFVVKAQIVSNLGEVLASRSVTLRESEIYWVTRAISGEQVRHAVPLFDRKNRSIVFGEMIMVIDPAQAFKGFVRRSMLIAATGILRSLLLAIVLIGIFHLVLAKPLIRLVDSLGATDPGNTQGRRLSAGPKHLADELGDLAAGINRYVEASENHLKIRERTEQTLRESEARIRGILENVADGVVTTDETSTIVSFNQAAEGMFGYSADEVIGQDVNILMGEADRSRHDGYVNNYLDTGKGKIIGIDPREVTGRRKDGSEFPLELSVGEMFVGDKRAFIGAMRDIGDRKANEDQLRQAQKMEAVGQLTGGVAHDFNNLLAIIQGNLDLINERVRSDQATQKLIDTALRATTRGADLIQHLLAFSRQQPLHPEPMDLNGLIEQMVELLERTLTETITLETSFAEDLWKTSVDRGQLETAILNLAINARDAMPEGGRLIIKTANVEMDEDYAKRHEDVRAGPYVMLAISDTGTGMGPEVVDKAFEPFFTTKEVGAGTGLGLSMVYGFARQSGGHAAIYSEPERGTTVKIYLPRGGDEKIATDHHEAVTATANGGSETILLVEDDPDVRESTQILLESLGYTVVAAEDGREALAKPDASPDVALLLSDIVLPGGMSGMELAKEVSNRRPEIRALYMSGYASSAAIHNDALKPGVNFIQKPFRKTALDRTIRRILEREEA